MLFLLNRQKHETPPVAAKKNCKKMRYYERNFSNSNNSYRPQFYADRNEIQYAAAARGIGTAGGRGYGAGGRGIGTRGQTAEVVVYRAYGLNPSHCCRLLSILKWIQIVSHLLYYYNCITIVLIVLL